MVAARVLLQTVLAFGAGDSPAHGSRVSQACLMEKRECWGMPQDKNVHAAP